MWPTEGFEDGFRNTVENLSPKLQVVQDPKAPAYLVVVPEDKMAIAQKAIAARQSRQLLQSLPTALLLGRVVI
jgi:hypothetical protein